MGGWSIPAAVCPVCLGHSRRAMLTLCAGNIPGISGNVDVDQFAGDSGNLANLCF